MKTYSEKEVEALMNEIGFLHNENENLIIENKRLKKQSLLFGVGCSKPIDTRARSGIVNLEFIKRDDEGVHYKATPIEEEFTQSIEDKTIS